MAVFGAESEVSFADTFLELFSLMPHVRKLELQFIGPHVAGHLHGVEAELLGGSGGPRCERNVSQVFIAPGCLALRCIVK